MSRIPSLLIVGVLLLSGGSIGAGASPATDGVVGRPAAADLNLVQYDDRGRCFNTCIAGNIFHKCQIDTEGEKENCCNRICRRLNNWADD